MNRHEDIDQIQFRNWVSWKNMWTYQANANFVQLVSESNPHSFLDFPADQVTVSGPVSYNVSPPAKVYNRSDFDTSTIYIYTYIYIYKNTI